MSAAPARFPASVAASVAVGAAACAASGLPPVVSASLFLPVLLLLVARLLLRARGALLSERWLGVLWRSLPVVALAAPVAAPAGAGSALALLVLALSAGVQALRLLSAADATSLGLLLLMSVVQAAYGAAVAPVPLAVAADLLFVAALVPAVVAVERRVFSDAQGGRAPGVRRLAVDRTRAVPPRLAIASTTARVLAFGIPVALLLCASFSVLSASRSATGGGGDGSDDEGPASRDARDDRGGGRRDGLRPLPALDSFRSGARTGLRLGFVAEVKRDPRPALLVRVLDPDGTAGIPLPGAPLTLRSGTYDVFTGTGWERSAPARAQREREDADDGVRDGWIRVGRFAREGTRFRLRVTDLVGGGSGVLFLMPEVERVRFARGSGAAALLLGGDGGISAPFDVPPGQAYEEEATRLEPEAATLLAARATAADAPLRSYVDAPPDADALRAFALEAAAGATSPDERARRIAAHLRARFTYTLAVPEMDRRAPVSDFLFRVRRGHCEYFASAMTLLLRSLGHPARLVVGFRGGDFLVSQGDYSFRGSHAHAWTEMFLAGVGWVSYDATPPDRQAADAAERPSDRRERGAAADGGEPSFLERMMRWSEDDRRWLADRIGDLAAAVVGAIWSVLRSPLSLLLIPLLFLAVVARRRLRGRSDAPTAARAAAAHLPAYARAVLSLRSAGVVRKRSRTAAEFVAIAGRAVPEADEPFRGLTRRFEDLRYGGRAPTPAGKAAAETEASAVAEAAAKRRRRP